MPYVGTRFPKLEKINSSAVAPEGAAGKMDSYKTCATPAKQWSPP
jgi:hypothetical protein